MRLVRAEQDGIVPPWAGFAAAARPSAGEARLPPDRRFRQMAEGEPPPPLAIPTRIRLHRCRSCFRYQGEGQQRSDGTEKEHRARAGTAHRGHGDAAWSDTPPFALRYFTLLQLEVCSKRVQVKSRK